MINILIITRCTCLDFLDKIKDNIYEQAKKFKLGKITWFVTFDRNKVNLLDINNKLIDELCETKLIDFFYKVTCSKNNADILNEVLFSSLLNNKDITHVYLLNDNNSLHPSFCDVCNTLKENDNFISLFHQIRKDIDTTNILLKIVNYSINSNNVNECLDTAQFIIPYKILVDKDGFVGENDVDTIKMLLENNVKYKCHKFAASFYNYFIELY